MRPFFSRRWHRQLGFGLLLVAVVLLLFRGVATAQIFDNYKIVRSVIEQSGGKDMRGSAPYSLRGSIGQSAAGDEGLSGMNPQGYHLQSGFWIGEAQNYPVFLPIITR